MFKLAWLGKRTIHSNKAIELCADDELVYFF